MLVGQITVKEFIERLQQFDPELPVTISNRIIGEECYAAFKDPSAILKIGKCVELQPQICYDESDFDE